MNQPEMIRELARDLSIEETDDIFLDAEIAAREAAQAGLVGAYHCWENGFERGDSSVADLARDVARICQLTAAEQLILDRFAGFAGEAVVPEYADEPDAYDLLDEIEERFYRALDQRYERTFRRYVAGRSGADARA